MAKKNRKHKKTQNNQKQNQSKLLPEQVNNQKEIVEKLDEDTNKIIEESSISDEEIKNVEPEVKKETPDDVTYKTAKELYHKIASVKKVFERRKNEYDKKLEELKRVEEELDKQKNDNAELKSQLEQRLRKYDAELKEINQLRVEGGWSSVIDKKLLDHYEEQLKEQEKILLEKVAELTNKHQEYISALSELETKKLELEKEYKEQLRIEKEKLQTEFKQKFSNKEAELEKLVDELMKKERELATKEKELNYEIEDFEDEKKFLTEKARKKVEDEILELNAQIQTLKEKNESIKNEYDKLKEELKYLGEYSAKDIIENLREKEKEIFELREKLETSPDILKIDELKRLQKEKIEWQDKLRKINAQLNDYKSRYENQKLLIGEKERLEFEKEELEQRIKLQQTALDELKEEVNELTRQTEDKITFVSCSEMDEKYKRTSEKLISNKITNGWLKKVQQAIAQVTENKLFYDENNIRSFIAGLAMSRFSILQGISGTGKTSLPKAFAKAIGGNYGIVEVQSGWKDRQDLIGYYNTFEKKYYEGKFLKLLYMACTPKYKDKPFFIILDEMNLSHPEHYFADMLSIMEETNPDKRILTISDKVKDTPKLMFELEEGGIGLKIPKNVWFIGTANHDETTLQFAPKTYDRANVLEMPFNIEKFEIIKIDYSKISIPNDTFLKFFKDQKWDDSKDNKIIEYLNGKFKTICNKLGLGWGNRLEKQIKLFVPVFKALGGSQANAIDHIIATKILRPIKGKYDLQETILKEMKEELKTNFKKQFNGASKKSLEIINNELIKKEENESL